MTGGFAYVLDIEDTFSQRYNPELVELVRMNAAELSEHALHLKVLIEDHVRETNSAWGNQLLDTLEQRLSQFWLVKPKAAALDSLLKLVNKAA